MKFLVTTEGEEILRKDVGLNDFSHKGPMSLLSQSMNQNEAGSKLTQKRL